MNNESKSSLKVLFICPSSYPITSGGHQRITHLLKALSKVGEVTLVHPSKGGQHEPNLKVLSTFCREVFTFPIESLVLFHDVRRPRAARWLRHKLRYLHPTLPALTQRRYSEEGAAIINQVCSKPFDLVWAERVYSIPMLPASLKGRIVIDLDDLEHRSFGRQPGLKKVHHMTPLYWLEFLKLRRVERGLHLLPYEFVVCSELDRKTLGAGPKLRVIPNGIDMPAGEATPVPAQSEPVLLFVGNMSGPPNIDAVNFFCRSVLPLIRRKAPDVTLFIVGSDPSPEVRRLHNGESVVVTGTVPEVSSYLRRAAAVVAPIRFGGGTRIKILEALAHGRPVVSTSMGAEGLELEDGKHLLIADSPSAFADACVRLLQDEGLRDQLGREGFQQVRNRYQWSTVERMVHDLVRNTDSQPVRAAV